jgi:hypothetical protein
MYRSHFAELFAAPQDCAANLQTWPAIRRMVAKQTLRSRTPLEFRPLESSPGRACGIASLYWRGIGDAVFNLVSADAVSK